MQTFNSFQEVYDAGLTSTGQNAGQSVFSGFTPVENLDLISEPSAVPPQDNNPSHIPQWGRSLGERMGNVEQRMGNVEQRVANLERNAATKAEMQQGFAQVKDGFTKVNQTIQTMQQVVAEIKDKMITKDDLNQMFGNR